MFNYLRGLSLTGQILVALVIGILVGLALNLWSTPALDKWLVAGVFDLVGSLFVRALQMLVVPLVFVSLVCGTSSLADPSRLGRIGGKAILLYLLTTALAITMALTLAVIFQPGSGSSFPAIEYSAADAPSVKEVLKSLIPTNPVQAMANGDMLAVIVFSILLGLSLTLTGDAGRHVKNFFFDLNEVVMKLVGIVMKLAPWGVFALIAEAIAEFGAETLADLLDYFLLVLAALVLHLFINYALLIRLLAGLNPLAFIWKMRSAMLFAFSTASSNATLPITLRTVTQRMGVKPAVASFTVPLGATINMDGTAIMQGIATVFIANIYGVDLSFSQLLTVVLMATMASIGAAGVPSVGLILLATVLRQVGLPVEGIGLILGIDRILDMVRTAVNITGDAMVSVVVGKSEKEFDEAAYHDPEAGADLTADPDERILAQPDPSATATER